MKNFGEGGAWVVALMLSVSSNENEVGSFERPSTIIGDWEEEA